MPKGRLEAFTDGVIAIIITIMVLELKAPAGHDLAALQASLPILLVYVLSYVNVGIYWNNHHHLLHAGERVNGKVLWVNLFLLFWLTLVPFVIRWMDESGFTPLPTAAYGVVLAMAAIAYFWLQWSIADCNGPESIIRAAIGKDQKGKLSLILYIAAIPLAFVSPWISIALYVAVSLMWFIPDRRIERFTGGPESQAKDTP
ncbi:MAG: TMEM175 family protein [Methylocella sp.]